MNSATPTNASSPRNWPLRSLRFTFFSDTPLQVPGAALFEEFFSLTPDAETHRRAEFLSEFSAEKGPVIYQAIVAGPKVDFLVSIGLSPETVQAGFPILPLEGNFESRFSEAATNLVAREQQRITRIALGAHYVCLVADKQEGYRILSEYVVGIRLDDTCSDFQYRINRPRNVSCAGQDVQFNRLSTWSCLVLKLGVQVPGGVSSQSTIGLAVSVTTDVNTVPELDFSTLSAQAKANAVNQLFDLTREIPQRGDVS